MSDVSLVTKYFPTINEGFIATTTAQVASGATSIPLSTVSGLVNGSVFVGIIEPGDATKQQVFTGTVNTAGLQITSVVWTRGTNVTHASGVSIVDYTTGTDLNMICNGILKQHNQDGSHAGITATSLTLSGNLNQTAGTVTLPTATVSSKSLASPAVFRAYLLTTPTMTAATFTKVVFDGATFNIGSGYSVTTGRFTAPFTGYYQLNANVTNNSPWGNALIGFFRNDLEYSWGTRYLSTTGTSGSNFAAGIALHHSDVVRLVAGDYVDVRYWADDGDNLIGASQSTYFSGFLIAGN